jgi:hypothetical protein
LLSNRRGILRKNIDPGGEREFAAQAVAACSIHDSKLGLSQRFDNAVPML